MFSAIGRIPVLLAVFFAGLSGVQAEDSMTCRDNQAFLCTSKAGCGEVRALYARARRGDFEAMTAFGLRLVMGAGKRAFVAGKGGSFRQYAGVDAPGPV